MRAIVRCMGNEKGPQAPPTVLAAAADPEPSFGVDAPLGTPQKGVMCDG